MNILSFPRKVFQSRYLRLVNLLGLALIFASFLLSYAYVKYELSYDRFHTNAGRLVRIMDSRNTESSVECRVYDYGVDAIFSQIPEIEQVVKLSRINTLTFLSGNKQEMLNYVYAATDNFFSVFDYPLISGDKKTVLDAPNKVVISEALAKRLFGNDSPVGKELKMDENRESTNAVLFVSGVFRNFPDNSHFHTEMILSREKDRNGFAYTYLLLKHGNLDLNYTEKKLTELFNKKISDKSVIETIHLMPLTHIHLHSRCSREMEPNGNINFIYLVVGANILLALIVFLNLWINAGLIFSSRKRYYQLLRLNGASGFIILKEELYLSLALGVMTVIVGTLIAMALILPLHIKMEVVSFTEKSIAVVVFLLSVMLASLLPVITSLSTTYFKNGKIDLRPSGRSMSSTRYLLTAQYVIVMLIVMLSFGIGKQISLIMNEQVGGNDSCIVVMKEQPDTVKQRLPLLKAELLKHPEIKGFTAAMQLPGDGIRDGVAITVDGGAKNVPLHVLVVGDDFIPFFRIPLLAGSPLPPDKYTDRQHIEYIINKETGKPNPSGLSEGYVINRRAMTVLGFKSPEEAIGKTIRLDNSNSLNYIPEGKIYGVTGNFVYTSVFEDNIPLIIFPRALYAQCFMIRLNGNDIHRSLNVLQKVWSQVNPDFPLNYTFLKDNYSKVYYSELSAENLVRLFSLLSLLIANLGLLVFVSFVAKKRTREIAIRRVNGASVWQIVKLLNLDYIRWIGLAFAIAVPSAEYLLKRWLQNFAYKTTLDWWIFALAGLFVLLLSVLSVSWMTWRAATANPVESLKGE